MDSGGLYGDFELCMETLLKLTFQGVWGPLKSDQKWKKDMAKKAMTFLANKLDGWSKLNKTKV